MGLNCCNPVVKFQWRRCCFIHIPYEWAKSVDSWEEIYSWWRCCIDWNDNTGFRYYINLIDKAAAGFEKTNPKFGRSSIVGNVLSISMSCYREIVEGGANRCIRLHCCLAAAIPAFSSHQHRGRTLHLQKEYSLLKVQMMHFLAISYF